MELRKALLTSRDLDLAEHFSTRQVMCLVNLPVFLRCPLSVSGASDVRGTSEPRADATARPPRKRAASSDKQTSRQTEAWVRARAAFEERRAVWLANVEFSLAFCFSFLTAAEATSVL
jgi:hypothetical protein